MKTVGLRIAALSALVVTASPAIAAPGVIDLSWGTCSPVITNIQASTQPASLIASVLGNDETHIAHQVRFLMADATRHVPDAWRFDAEGCQGQMPPQSPLPLTINHSPVGALSKTCPPFQDIEPSNQIRDFRFVNPGTNYPTTQIRGVLAVSYPNGRTSIASQRYFLAEFRFDHGFSVEGTGTPGISCGGLETPMCFMLLYGSPSLRGPEGTSSYLRPDRQEIAFLPGSIAVTVNGLQGCPSVPAARSTWGQVKGAYRR